MLCSDLDCYNFVTLENCFLQIQKLHLSNIEASDK